MKRRVSLHTCAGTSSIRRPAADYKDAVVPVPLKDYVSGKLRRSLVVLWAAVGAILLIACVNLSNLLAGARFGAVEGICDAGCAGREPRPHRSAAAD